MTDTLGWIALALLAGVAWVAHELRLLRTMFARWLEDDEEESND